MYKREVVNDRKWQQEIERRAMAEAFVIDMENYTQLRQEQEEMGAGQSNRLGRKAHREAVGDRA